MADSAFWDEPVDEPVDEPLRDALHALRDRVTQFRAHTTRPSPHAVDVFWLALSDDFDAALCAATARAVQRWVASLDGPRSKGQRGRPGIRRLRLVHTKSGRPFDDDSDTAIVTRAIALVEQAERDGHRLRGPTALADVLLEHLPRDAATRTTFEGWFEYHYHPTGCEGPGSERRAQRAAVGSMDPKRFARIERRLRRALGSRRHPRPVRNVR
jgi:hypothetical protein